MPQFTSPEHATIYAAGKLQRMYVDLMLPEDRRGPLHAAVRAYINEQYAGVEPGPGAAGRPGEVYDAMFTDINVARAVTDIWERVACARMTSGPDEMGFGGNAVAELPVAVRAAVAAAFCPVDNTPPV